MSDSGKSKFLSVGICRTRSPILTFLMAVVLSVAGVCLGTHAHAGPRLSITTSTNVWQIGTVPLNGKSDTWLDQHGTFAVSNSGDVAVSLYISVTNSSPSGWIADEQPGWETFSMGWSEDNGQALPQYRHILPSPCLMVERLDTNDVFRFDLEFFAPTGSGQVGVQQIRLTALAVEQ